MNSYTPPYNTTEEMLELVSEIMECLGQLSGVNDLAKLPKLRRANRIKSIHSSLAIEHNSLSLEQVSDIINGKRVLGAPDEIQEVKNAIDAYRLLENLDTYKISELLKAHKAMTNGLIEESGNFRTREEGVFAGERCIHVAPPAKNVPSLMQDLFDWLNISKTHPLIKSSVFHYEFEFIHPFRDGNGRMGRFWQTALLSRWKPIFAWIPVESMIIDKQEEYYTAISQSTAAGNSNPFIIFMLEAFLKAIKGLVEDSNDHMNHISDRVRQLMNIIKDYPMSSIELMKLLGLKSRETFRQNYLMPALESGLIGMTIPEKPTSRNQMYFKK